MQSEIEMDDDKEPAKDPSPRTEQKGHLLDKPLESAVNRNEKLYPKQGISQGWKATSWLAFLSLGIIYGDIGTSPLYVVSSMFPNDPTERDVLGGMSLIFWSITMVVTIKYVAIVMNFNFHGEGGIFALLCSLDFSKLPEWKKTAATAIGIFGAAFLIGDGIITPAISVLSAVEGLSLVWDNAAEYESYIAAVILLALYLCERFGTHKLGNAFGGIMLIWFVLLAIFGIIQIAQTPAVMKALSPHYGFEYIGQNGWPGFLFLGTVVLAVTGVEALYADLGHFGARPVRISWLCVVYPSLILNYFGQGALIIANPSLNSNPFFYSVPSGFLIPMLIIATLATIIASQGVISGAFSLISQAMGKGIFPRMKIAHTSEKVQGQVYISFVNYFLMVTSIAVTLIYRHSAKLTDAYGLAVSGVMVLTSVLLTAVLHYQTNTPRYLIALYCIVFYTIDLAFFISNITKFVTGGYLPIAVGIVVAVIMLTWKAGREETERLSRQNNLALTSIESLVRAPKVNLVDTIAVFMNSNYHYTPTAFTALFARTHTVPTRSIFLTVQNLDVPFVQEKDRFVFQQLPLYENEFEKEDSKQDPNSKHATVLRHMGVFRVVLFYGFFEVMDLGKVLPKIIEETKILTSLKNVENERPILGEEQGASVLRKSDNTFMPSEQNPAKGEDEAEISNESDESQDWNNPDPASIIVHITPTVTYYLGLERVTPSQKKWLGHRLWVGFYSFLLRNSTPVTSLFRIPKEDTIEIVIPLKL